jgi:hypothetical protein
MSAGERLVLMAAPAANFAAAIAMSAPIAAMTTNLEVEFSAIVVLRPL